MCPCCATSREPGWLCADHPGKPWGHDDCGAEGAPCSCNPEGRVDLAQVFASLDAEQDRQRREVH